jgi:ribosomal protein S18 acetylase RimI-like enzyme
VARPHKMRRPVIQRCGRQHVLGVCLLNLATFPPTERSIIPGTRLVRDWWSLQRRLSDNHIVIAKLPSRFGQLGGGVVGSVEVHSGMYLRKKGGSTLTIEQQQQLQPYLCSMAVAPYQRGKGIGEALVKRVLDETRTAESQSASIMLQVEANNTAAMRLYERCGFTRLSDARCQIHVMRRKLCPIDT